MLRNHYGDLCIHCRNWVPGGTGALYGPGGSNTVVCLDCLYGFYGEQRGFFRPPPGESSRFEGLINPLVREAD